MKVSRCKLCLSETEQFRATNCMDSFILFQKQCKCHGLLIMYIHVQLEIRKLSRVVESLSSYVGCIPSSSTFTTDESHNTCTDRPPLQKKKRIASGKKFQHSRNLKRQRCQLKQDAHFCYMSKNLSVMKWLALMKVSSARPELAH